MKAIDLIEEEATRIFVESGCSTLDITKLMVKGLCPAIEYTSWHGCWDKSVYFQISCDPAKYDKLTSEFPDFDFEALEDDFNEPVLILNRATAKEAVKIGLKGLALSNAI
jgi:hypothetical protein